MFAKIKNHVEMIAFALRDRPIEDLEFNRHHVHNDPALVKIHEYLVSWISKHFGRPIKKSYCFLSIYREGGVCPRHVDRPQCQYTIDICISHRDPWIIYVDDLPYKLNENDALIYSGTGSPHYRQRMTTGNHCFLVFFHFVEESFEGPLD
jgi:hypothetical protein